MRPVSEVWPPLRVAWERTHNGKPHRGFSDVTPAWQRDGLAVTPAVDLPAHWTVIHVRSGWAVIRDIRTQGIAIEVARRFLALGDWQRGRLRLRADRPFIKQCVELRE